MPGFAFVTVCFQAAVFIFAGLLCGFEVYYVEVAAFLVNGEAAVIAHTEEQPSPIGADSRQKNAQTCILSGKYGFHLAPGVAFYVIAYPDQVILDFVKVGGNYTLVRPCFRCTAEI